MDVRNLPALNATLNSIAALLLLFGYYFIRRGEKARHELAMLLACGASALFLTSYLIYHFNVGSVPFQGEGWIRPLYFTILISHIVLAAAIVPLALVTVWRATRRRWYDHRRIAKWTWPVWMYVSVTGVLIYVMLYEM